MAPRYISQVYFRTNGFLCGVFEKVCSRADQLLVCQAVTHYVLLSHITTSKWKYFPHPNYTLNAM
jgi:hypothetical protein